MFTKAWRWRSFSLQVFPGALRSIKPSGPRALNRTPSPEWSAAQRRQSALPGSGSRHHRSRPAPATADFDPHPGSLSLRPKAGPRRSPDEVQSLAAWRTSCSPPESLTRSGLETPEGVSLHAGWYESSLRTWGLKLKERIGFKRAAVAVARKLAVVMHAMLRSGQLFDRTAGVTA